MSRSEQILSAIASRVLRCLLSNAVSSVFCLSITLKEYKLLCVNQIDSARELVSFIEKKSADISALEAERQRIYNRIRRPKSEEEKKQDKAAARAISAKLKPLREELKTARSITERYPHILELLETERAMETQVKTKNRERNYER